jgi:hypothetical protein
MSGAIGSFGGAVTSWKMGAEQKKIAYRQATYYERQGKLATQKAEEERTQRSKELDQLYGSQRARYSASGVTQYEGSPQEVIKKSMEEGNAELDCIRYWGERAAESYRIMAWESRKAGRLAKHAGEMAAWGQAAQGVAGIGSSAFSILGG